jgi:hypothetical protein
MRSQGCAQKKSKEEDGQLDGRSFSSHLRDEERATRRLLCGCVVACVSPPKGHACDEHQSSPASPRCCEGKVFGLMRAGLIISVRT